MRSINAYLTAAGYHPPAGGAKTPAKQTALILDSAAELPYFKVFSQPLLSLPELYRLVERLIERIVRRAGWRTDELHRIPLLLGSTSYTIADCEYRVAHHRPLPEAHTLATIGAYLRERFNTQVFSFATSCTSAAHAVGYGAKMIANGFCDKALVIGFEMFNRLTFEHFRAMQLSAEGDAYLPFAESNGLVLGEGLACVALSSRPATDFHCRLTGFTGLTDHENLTNNDEAALRRLLTRILRNAQLEAKQIRAVKVHGVGSSADAMEMRVLAEMLPRSEWVLTKPYVGHTLGAAAALESALLLQWLQTGTAPPLPQQEKYHALPIAHGNALPDGYYLNYFLGFGGSNAGWILEWKNT